jgi:lipopolysaccharide transport protein LptA
VNRFITIVLCSLILSLNTQAQKKETPKKETPKKEGDAKIAPKKKVPVKITADHMRYNEDNSLVYFTGNVHVDDGAMKVDSDFMTVKLDKNRDPILIICEKNVIIRKEGSISNSDRAEYFLPIEKIVLTGKPKVVRTNNNGDKETMTGKVITFFKNTNVIESQGVGLEFPSSGGSKKDPKDSKDAKDTKDKKEPKKK